MFFQSDKDQEDLRDFNLGNIFDQSQEILISQSQNEFPIPVDLEKDDREFQKSDLFDEPRSPKSPKEDSQPAPSLKDKREKGRIRSKISRERKKKYIQELEQEIDDLKKENQRLVALLLQSKNAKTSQSGPDKLVNDIHSKLRNYVINCSETKTEAESSECPSSIMSFCKNSIPEVKEKFTNFLDEVFKLIINNPYPAPQLYLLEKLGQRVLNRIFYYQKGKNLKS